MALPNPFSIVDRDNLRFVIMDAPTEGNVKSYVPELKKYNVKDVVRVCEPTYSSAPFSGAGIRCHDHAFQDGGSPPDKVIEAWLGVVNSMAKTNAKLGKSQAKEAVAVHCVAGLGRAPVLVCIALIESGMDPLDAVEFVRARRRGAINAKQLAYLEKYKRKGGKNCIVM